MTESAGNHVLVSFHFDTRRRGYYRHSGPVQVVERERLRCLMSARSRLRLSDPMSCCLRSLFASSRSWIDFIDLLVAFIRSCCADSRRLNIAFCISARPHTANISLLCITMHHRCKKNVQIKILKTLKNVKT